MEKQKTSEKTILKDNLKQKAGEQRVTKTL